MTAVPRYAKFATATLAFLEALAANNNREWFKENKSRYEEQVLDVALRFIQSMQDPLHEIAPHSPRGFDMDHEFIDDIKRKSFIAVRNVKRDDCLSPQFQRKVESSFKAAEPFMRFLCKSVGVPF